MVVRGNTGTAPCGALPLLHTPAVVCYGRASGARLLRACLPLGCRLLCLRSTSGRIAVVWYCIPVRSPCPPAYATVLASGDDRQRLDRQSFQFVNIPAARERSRDRFRRRLLSDEEGSRARPTCIRSRPESAGFFLFYPSRVRGAQSSLILIGSPNDAAPSLTLRRGFVSRGLRRRRRLLRAAQQPPSVVCVCAARRLR